MFLLKWLSILSKDTMKEKVKITGFIHYHYKISGDNSFQKYTEIFDWCKSNFGMCSFIEQVIWYVGSQEFVFRDKNAAMLFKLTWM
jgi:hypothetical protein